MRIVLRVCLVSLKRILIWESRGTGTGTVLLYGEYLAPHRVLPIREERPFWGIINRFSMRIIHIQQARNPFRVDFGLMLFYSQIFLSHAMISIGHVYNCPKEPIFAYLINMGCGARNPHGTRVQFRSLRSCSPKYGPF
jgi:hypothetical protein